jgi:hypothetical protein
MSFHLPTQIVLRTTCNEYVSVYRIESMNCDFQKSEDKIVSVLKSDIPIRIRTISNNEYLISALDMYSQLIPNEESPSIEKLGAFAVDVIFGSWIKAISEKR